METMALPDYKDGSIVNLMASVLESYGAKSQYAPLKILPPDKLKDRENVVLIVLDGLGYEYLRKHGKDLIFSERLEGRITSVFPSTTAACVTTFNTGLAPQQHAITGWFVYLKEMGTISTILGFTPRYAGMDRAASFTRQKIKPKIIFDQKSVFERIRAKSYIITREGIADSVYTLAHTGKAKRIGYRNLTGFFNKLKMVLARKGRKFVYAYWPEIDSLAHKYGTSDKKVERHLKQLDKKFRTLYRSLDPDTMMVITADHGLINTGPSKRIFLKDHPKLEECLAMPLSGEHRAAYCYVHPSKARQFEDYVRTKFKNKCSLYKSESLVKKGYFGLFSANEKLNSRIGDYVLIMKENYVLDDFVCGEKMKNPIGVHGGVSDEEMYVPLIVLRK
jgi:predicted AlkP superfamily pyrophosphatase or phosphodiesterase